MARPDTSQRKDVGFNLRDKPVVNGMLTRGVSRQVFSIKPYSLEESCSMFVSRVDGLKPKRVRKDKQISMVEKILKNPFYGPYVCCIGGKPNDYKAKLLAATIMYNAMKIQGDATKPDSIKRKLQGKSYPLWVNLSGTFNNPLLETNDKPSMLILSNFPDNCTQVKLEKARDLLEHFSNIPRVVVTAGIDPLTLFNSRLYLPLNCCCFLTNSSMKGTVEI